MPRYARTMDGPDNQRTSLDWRIVLASIAGFWLVYMGAISLRAVILEFSTQGEMALRRTYVSAAGFVLTVAYWLLIRLFDHYRMRTRAIVAMLIAIPIAVALAGANFYAFNVYDTASLFDIEEKIPRDKQLTVTQEIADGAVTRYFFLIAWASFYLALGFARESGLAERRAAQFARAAQTAELRALRYQVNPHFLFNTLNSLSALVMKGEKALADAMIMNLSTFYRTSLSGEPAEDVPLSEEIELQKLYLDIEAVRFPKRLLVSIDLPCSLESAAVPGLILQPLVENAIKHGVARVSDPVVLTISAREEGGVLSLTVVNSGAIEASASQALGIGLANVRERLQARFGDAARLDHGAQPQGGYRATVTLPYLAAR